MNTSFVVAALIHAPRKQNTLQHVTL